MTDRIVVTGTIGADLGKHPAMPGHVVEGIDHGVELEVLAIGVNELLVLVAVREGSLLAEVDINDM